MNYTAVARDGTGFAAGTPSIVIGERTTTPPVRDPGAMTTPWAVITAATFCWLGMVLAISFRQAPLVLVHSVA